MINSHKVKIDKEGVLLEKTDNEFENVGVFNPAVIQDGEDIHMFYRAVREGNFSTIGYCKLSEPLKIAERWTKPIISPDFEYESQGVEDPRIVKVDNTFLLTYTAYDRKNALGALASSKDLKTFTKHGIITPQVDYEKFKELLSAKQNINEKYFQFYTFYKQRDIIDETLLLWDKNVMFFPHRIKGKLVFLHRIRPGIQIVYLDDFQETLSPAFWEDYLDHFTHYIVLEPEHQHEASYIGGGCPPLQTKEGWLLIYHSSEDTPHGYVYHACAALLDLDNPTRVIARLDYPLFSPELHWEKVGYVNNVVFPTGTVLQGDKLFIYYGAADCKVGVASLSLSELIEALLKLKT